MSESTIEWFDLSRKCLALVMQSYRDQIFIGFEKVCTTARGRPARYWRKTGPLHGSGSALQVVGFDRARQATRHRRLNPKRRWSVRWWPRPPPQRSRQTSELVTSQAAINEDHCVSKIVGWGDARKRIRWVTSPSFIELSRGISLSLHNWLSTQSRSIPKEQKC